MFTYNQSLVLLSEMWTCVEFYCALFDGLRACSACEGVTGSPTWRARVYTSVDSEELKKPFMHPVLVLTWNTRREMYLLSQFQ